MKERGLRERSILRIGETRSKKRRTRKEGGDAKSRLKRGCIGYAHKDGDSRKTSKKENRPIRLSTGRGGKGDGSKGEKRSNRPS